MNVSLFLPIFEALNGANVRYIAVGGIAVVLHGFPRITGDIDLVLDLAPDNALAAISLLESIGFKPRAPVKASDFANAATRENWITEKGLQVFSLFRDKPHHIEVDLFVREPMPFAELLQRSKVVVAGGIPIRVASIDDLISLKRKAGRTKDIEDIEALELIKTHVKE